MMSTSVAAFASASRSEGPVAIESGAAIIGAYATVRRPGDKEIATVIATTVSQLDELAGSISVGSSRELMLALFGTGDFAGNIGNYYDPENSLLPSLFRYRRGNPITLAALAISVGRRLGITLHGVSMPGHFLLSGDDAPNVWLDPFHSGAVLNQADLSGFFRHLHGDDAQLDPGHLKPVGPDLVLARMLNNLQMIYGNARSMNDLAWVGLLSATLRGGPGWATSIADTLETEQRYAQAASIFETAAEFGPEPQRGSYVAAAKRLRGLG
jgi:hypothetical protein